MNHVGHRRLHAMKLCEKCLEPISETIIKSSPERLGEIFLDSIVEDNEVFCDDCKYELGLLMVPFLDE